MHASLGPAAGELRAAGDADADATIFRIAAGQHGVVSHWQLLGAGVPAHVIAYRLRRGRLRALHRGVYRVGPVAPPYHREMAAVLACGDPSALSHGTAAALWEMIPPLGAEVPVEVLCLRSLRGPGEGVRLHRVCRIDPEEVCLMHGMRLTVPARTLLDLASCIGGRNLERALAHAERRQIVTRDAIEAMLARHHGRRGAPLLSTILRAAGGPALTRSEAEARFLDLVRRGALPRPAANVMVEGVEVDFIWRDRRLVAEIDGFAYHTGRAAFERDRRRDGVLAAAGYRVIRVTWRQLTTAPEEVLVLVARALFDPRSPETQPR